MKEIQDHVKVRQGRQKSYVVKSRRQSQFQMGQKALWAIHTISKATWKNIERNESQKSSFIYDSSAYFHKTHKFRGGNSLRGKDCNIPTLTHIYLNHLYFHDYLFNQMTFINSNAPNLFI